MDNMTDGIIQKVFGRYLTAWEHEADLKIVGYLQRELISEIKKTCLPSQYQDMPTAWIIRKKLIGDNE